MGWPWADRGLSWRTCVRRCSRLYPIRLDIFTPDGVVADALDIRAVGKELLKVSGLNAERKQVTTWLAKLQTHNTLPFSFLSLISFFSFLSIFDPLLIIRSVPKVPSLLSRRALALLQCSVLYWRCPIVHIVQTSAEEFTILFTSLITEWDMIVVHNHSHRYEMCAFVWVFNKFSH